MINKSNTLKQNYLNTILDHEISGGWVGVGSKRSDMSLFTVTFEKSKKVFNRLTELCVFLSLQFCPSSCVETAWTSS